MGVSALSAGADSSWVCQWLGTSNWHSARVRDAGRFTLLCQGLCGRWRKKTKQRQKAHNGEQTGKHEKCEDHLLTAGCVSTHYRPLASEDSWASWLRVLFPMECWSKTSTWQDRWSPEIGHMLSNEHYENYGKIPFYHFANIMETLFLMFSEHSEIKMSN